MGVYCGERLSRICCCGATLHRVGLILIQIMLALPQNGSWEIGWEILVGWQRRWEIGWEIAVVLEIGWGIAS
jgi:hypothetical protein